MTGCGAPRGRSCCLFPPRTSGAPVLLGWNADGVWFVQYGGPPHLIRYNPSTGAADWFTIGDSRSGTRVVTGGAALPAGTLVWSQNCNSWDWQTGLCSSGAYALWLMNPLTGVDELLVSAGASPDDEFPQVIFAAPSPNGRMLAYILETSCDCWRSLPNKRLKLAAPSFRGSLVFVNSLSSRRSLRAIR